jgi:hypothetical protein
MLRKLTSQPALFILNAAFIALVALVAPLERSLGATIRLVYFHGAWVWAGKLAFGAAAAAGLAGLVLRRWHPARSAGWTQRLPTWVLALPDWVLALPDWVLALPDWVLALGRTGLFFWATYLPMSLLVMQVSWGGLFLDEPRFRIPLTFGIVGLLLQAGFVLLNQADLVCLGSLVYGVALWAALNDATNVLHPDSPVYTSGSFSIEFFFTLLLVLSALLAFQIAHWLHSRFK